MEYIISYCTDKGLYKEINQDALSFKAARYNKNLYLMAVVCDGMGGLSEGENASAYAITKVSEWFEQNFASLIRQGKNMMDIRKDLDTRLHMINSKLNNYSAGKDKMLGTTLTSIIYFSDSNKMLTAHIGDSRAYKITDTDITILTNDHSVVGEEVRDGLITEEEANQDERQNQLTKCIGADFEDITFDYMIHDCEHCCYLLCSDGFRKKISSSELHQTLSPSKMTDKSTADRALRSIVELNMKRDEDDNITGLLLKIM